MFEENLKVKLSVQETEAKVKALEALSQENLQGINQSIKKERVFRKKQIKRLEEMVRKISEMGSVPELDEDRKMPAKEKKQKVRRDEE